ncbi:putative cation/H(+) antiporter 14-like [Capsicum annuum]|nr:putative cation/H(+) antiporter 14-like [Capsicum annuum]
MEKFTLKLNLLGNILVRLVPIIVLVFLARFAYIFTVNIQSPPESFTLSVSGDIYGADNRNYYYSVFQNLISDGFLSPNSYSLCIETVTGEDVEALIDIGVVDSIGISQNQSPPLIYYGNADRQPFDDDSFDFEFAGNGVLDRSSKPIEFAKEVSRTLKPGGIFVIHTISKDNYSLNSLIQLFSSFKLIRSIEIDGYGYATWQPLIRQVIFEKVIGCVDNFEKMRNLRYYCFTPEYKRELIQKAEPLKLWRKPKRDVKNVKYLSSMVDISFKKRYIYVAVGARSYGSSIGSWFNREYPKQNKTFEVYAIEGVREYHEEYRRKGVSLLPYVAWLRNETLYFEITREQTRKSVERGRGIGRTQSARSSLDYVTDSDKILGFDFAGWLMSLFEERDYLVVKMDVEGSEFHLVKKLIESGAICLIDELFLECHYDDGRWQRFGYGKRSRKYDKTYSQCLELFTSLRDIGILIAAIVVVAVGNVSICMVVSSDSGGGCWQCVASAMVVSSDSGGGWCRWLAVILVVEASNACIGYVSSDSGGGWRRLAAILVVELAAIVVVVGNAMVVSSDSAGGWHLVVRIDSGLVVVAVGNASIRYGFYIGDDPLDYAVPSLLLQLSLISIFTRILQSLLKPLGQPLIVSQILGGVILGPSVIGKNGELSSKVFPTKGRSVLDTLSVFGFMLFIFQIGVKIDLSIVLKSSKKALAVGILVFFVPFGLASFTVFLLEKFVSLDPELIMLLSRVVILQSMTAYPGIACFLDELKILNSEMGRLASSSSIICDICHWTILSLKYALGLAKAKSARVTLGSLGSIGLYIIVIAFGIRPAIMWAIRQTPEGKPIKNVYVLIVLVLLLWCGFTGEVIGLSSIVACFLFGLFVPDGPPLGAAIVERLDCFVSVLLMPPFFTICGLQMNVFSIVRLKNLGVLQLVVLVSFIGKTVGTILPLLLWRVPLRDAFSLALIMNSKGIMELAFLNDFKKNKDMSEENYTIMLISVVVITGVVSPLVKVLYDPSSKYIAYKRRTIMHSREKDEFRILACIHSQENVRAVISLLQVSNPTKESCINLVVLHLTKLTGRASSVLIAHQKRDRPSTNPTQSERIFNIFEKLEQQNSDLIMVHCYKGVSPYVTMHNDVCSLALEKRTTLIIVPFHKHWMCEKRIETSYAYRHLNKNVLEKSPCSVGILIDRCTKKSRYAITVPSLYRVVVLFFGGADDREALSYAERMSKHPSVKMTFIRFTRSGNAFENVVGGSERSKVLDSQILNEFNLQYLHSEQVSYQEAEVKRGADVLEVIKSLGRFYDLVMVGKRHVDSPILLQLTKRTDEDGELGIVGGILVASDFESETSVLVVQQQTRLWGLHDPEESTHLRRIN